MEEYLDIVDENNNPTGEKALRSKIHAEGIWHQVIHIYIFRQKEDRFEFLVHLRSKFKDLSPNKWDLRFGGHIESGAKLEDALKKEMQEEIGLEIDNPKDLIEMEWTKGGIFPNVEFIKIHFLRYNGEIEDLKFNDGEVQDVKWMTMQEIKESAKENPEDWNSSHENFEEKITFLMEKIK